MARTKQEDSSDEAYSSEEEQRVNNQPPSVEEDDEELEAVARSADSDEDNVDPGEAPVSDDEVVPVEDDADEVPLRLCFPSSSIHILISAVNSAIVVLVILNIV